MQGISVKELKETYDSLDEEVKNTALGAMLGKQLESMKSIKNQARDPRTTRNPWNPYKSI